MSKRDWIKLAVIAAVLVCAVLLVLRIDISRGTREKELLEKAVRDAALTCYAAEGVYPSQLSYLRTHYQLAYDENRYIVFYDAWGENVMPDIVVSEAGVSGA